MTSVVWWATHAHVQSLAFFKCSMIQATLASPLVQGCHTHTHTLHSNVSALPRILYMGGVALSSAGWTTWLSSSQAGTALPRLPYIGGRRAHKTALTWRHEACSNLECSLVFSAPHSASRHVVDASARISYAMPGSSRERRVGRKKLHSGSNMLAHVRTLSAPWSFLPRIPHQDTSWMLRHAYLMQCPEVPGSGGWAERNCTAAQTCLLMFEP